MTYWLSKLYKLLFLFPNILFLDLVLMFGGYWRSWANWRSWAISILKKWPFLDRNQELDLRYLIFFVFFLSPSDLFSHSQRTLLAICFFYPKLLLRFDNPEDNRYLNTPPQMEVVCSSNRLGIKGQNSNFPRRTFDFALTLKLF